MPECGCRPTPGNEALLHVEVVQEDERLQHLTQVTGAHQPRDRAVAAPSRAMDDLPRPRLDRRRCQRCGHRGDPPTANAVPHAIRAVRAKRTRARGWRVVEHGEVGHDGSGHDPREQHGSERGLAGDDEEERAQHLERPGEVSEPLDRRRGASKRATMSGLPRSFPDPAASERQCHQHLERPQRDVQGLSRGVAVGEGVTGVADGRHTGNLGPPEPLVLTVSAAY